MPITLTNLLDDVQEITRRPDARARAVVSVNSLIGEICSRAKYGEDLIELTILNPGSFTSATISLEFENQPAVRAIEYVTPNNGSPLVFASPRNAIDQVRNHQGGVYYRSGSNLILNALTGWTELRLGYWRAMPRLSETAGANTHWLLDVAYEVLFNGTIARVFAATGDDASGNKYESIYRDQLLNFRRSRLSGEEL